MDTNTRQHTSTHEFEQRPQQTAQPPASHQPPAQQAQQNASRYSRNSARYKNGAQALRAMNAATAEGSRRAATASAAAEGKRARNGALDQNTAFGTQKNPEGFVQTWKSASHAWRWRAVLCVFLALLLVMMQPTGNALYRSWNASTGETMGLAAAFENGEDLNTNPDDTQAQAEEKTTVVDTDSGRLVPAMFAQTEDAPMSAASVPAATFNSKLIFHENVDDATPQDWAKKTGGKDPTSGADYADVFKDDSTYIRRRANEGRGVTDEEINTSVKAAGNMGATTWIGGEATKEQNGRYSLTYDPSDPYVGYNFWSLGYELMNWYSTMTTKLKKTTSLYDNKNKTVVSVPDLTEAAPSFDLRLEAYSGSSKTVYSFNGNDGDSIAELYNEESVSNGKYIDTDFYATWRKRDTYRLKLYTGTYRLSAQRPSFIKSGNIESLSWDSPIDLTQITNSWDTSDGGVDLSAIAFAIYRADNSGTIIDNGFTGHYAYQLNYTSLGQLLNPTLAEDASVDPWFIGSDFFYANDREEKLVAALALLPVFVVRYDANGGSGEGKSFSAEIDDVEEVEAPDFPAEATTVLTAAQANIGTNGTREFKGWAFSADETTPDALPGDDLKTKLKSSSQASAVNTRGELVKSIHLYAVWGDAAQERALTWEKSDSDPLKGEYDLDLTNAASKALDDTSYESLESQVTLKKNSAWTADGSDAVFAAKYRTEEFDGETPAYQGEPASISWEVNPEGTAVSADTTFTATVTPAKYTVTYVIGDNGAETDPTATATWKTGDDTPEGYTASGSAITKNITYGANATDPGVLANLTPAEGYYKYALTDSNKTPTEIKGVWTKSTNGTDWTAVVDSEGNATTPDHDRDTVTSNVTYKFTLTPVYEVTFKASDESVEGWSELLSNDNGKKDDKAELIYKGEDLATYTTLPLTTAASGYYKGYDPAATNATKGGWHLVTDGTAAADTTTPITTNIQADATYIYKYTPVHTVTFKIATTDSTPQGTWSDKSTEDKVAYAFDNETATTANGGEFTVPTGMVPATNYYKGTYTEASDKIANASGSWSNAGAGSAISSGTPVIANVTADWTYTYSYKRVWTVTLKAGDGAAKWVGADNKNDKTEQVFNGDNLTTINGSAIDKPLVPAANYYKGEQSTDDTKVSHASGSWTASNGGELVSSLPKTTNITSNATYTYDYKRVWTVQFALDTGTSTWSNNETGTKTEEVFNGENVVTYADYASGTVFAVPDTGYYKGTQTTAEDKRTNASGSWTASNNGELVSSLPKTTNITSDGTYTYNYLPVYTVTYKVVNGTWKTLGTGNNDLQLQYFENESITAPTTNPQSTDYEADLNNWYLSETANQTIPQTATSTINNAVYTYKYTGKAGTVTFSNVAVKPTGANAATYSSLFALDVQNNKLPEGTQDYNYNDTVTLPDLTADSAATATGYTFKGWSVKCNGADVPVTLADSEHPEKGGTFSMPNRGVTVEAQWEINTVDITWAFVNDQPAGRGLKLTAAGQTTADATASDTIVLKAEYGATEATISAGAAKLVSGTGGYDANYYDTDALTWYTNDAGTTPWETGDGTGTVTSNQTYYGKPHDRMYTFTLTTVNGGFKVGGADTGVTHTGDTYTFTTTNTYTYDKKTSEIIDAENITFDTLGSDASAANDVYTWSSDVNPTANNTTLGNGAGSSNDKSFTKTYAPYHTVTFKIIKGTWKRPGGDTQNVASDLVYYVPDKKSLTSDGVLTKNNNATKYSATGYGLPADETDGDRVAKANDGYDQATGAWVATDGASAAWTDAAASTDVEGDLTYVYKFTEADVPYKLHVYYQVATQSDNEKINTKADYELDASNHSGFSTMSGNAKFGSTVNVATLIASNGLSAHLTANHFTTTPQNPTGDPASTNGTTSTFTMNNTFTDGSANDVDVYLYFNRTPVTYKYEYTNDVPTGNSGNVSADDMAQKDGRWGQEVTLLAPTVAAGYAFNGWYANSGETKLATGSTYNLAAPSTTFTGTWQEGSYTATFQFTQGTEGGIDFGWVTDDDTNFSPQFKQGTAAAAAVGAPVTQEGIAYKAKVTTPTVVFAQPKKYEVEKWYYKVDGGKYNQPSTWTEITDGDGTPSAIEILEDGYVFTPKLKLIDYTVTYTAGAYGSPLNLVANATQFTGLHYGATVPSVDLSNTTDVKSKDYGEAGSPRYAPVVAAVNAAQYTVQPASNTNPWEVNSDYAANLIEDNGAYKVGGNLQFDYTWYLKPYTFNLKGVEGSSLATASFETYSGGYNDSTHGQNPARPSELTWDDDVFAGVQNQLGINPYAPTKDGYQFAGWKKGTSNTQDAAVIVAPGQTFKVNQAYYTAGESTQSTQYLWATWTGNTVKLVYNRNIAGNSGVEWGTGDSKVEEAVYVNDSVTVGDTPILDALADMKVDGAAFAPAGYTFLGWCPTSDLSGSTYYADNDKTKAYEVKADKPSDEVADKDATNQLYAKWRANTYKVQWKDFDNNLITNKQVWDAFPGLRATLFSSTEPAGEDASKPFTQEFTYNVPDDLVKMEDFFTRADLKGDHNSGDNVLKGWTYNSTDVADGATISTLTTEDAATVILAPQMGDKVTLTYDLNAGSDTVSANPLDQKYKKPAESQYGKASTDFTLAGTVYRAGYTFMGWKIGDAAAIEAGGTWTAGTEDATAVAQWRADPRKLTINFYRQDALGSSNYPLYESKEIGTFVTDSTAKAGEKVGNNDLTKLDSKDFVVESYYEGYTYNSSKGNISTTIKADGTASINLYYDLKAYKIKYRYTPLTGTVLTTNPPEQEEVATYGTHTLVAFPNAGGANWPTGWEPAGGNNWYLMAPDAANKENVTTLGTPLTGGTVEVNDANANDDNEIDIVLPWQTAHITATFKLATDEEYGSHAVSKGSDVVTSGDDTVSKVLLYNTAPETVMSQIEVGVSESDYSTGYRFLGWTVEGENDAVVDMSAGITENTVFVAKIGKVNSVTWKPGAHSKSNFSTAQKIDDNGPTVFINLDDPFLWSAATLTLQPDDLDTNGNPAGQPGWTFKNFTDEDNNEYASVSAITSTLTSETDRKRSYTFTANWEKTEQSVTFAPGEGAASGSQSVVLKGLTNDNIATDPANADAKAPAAPSAKAGWTFTGYYVGTFTDENGKETSMRLKPGNPFTFPAKDATLTAEWTHDEVTINYKSDDPEMGTVSTLTTGTVFADGTSGTTPEGASEALPGLAEPYVVQALPNPGYRFVGWVKQSDPNTLLTAWYDADQAKFVDAAADDPDGAKKVLNPEYGKLTVGKEGALSLYKGETYIALFEPDPFTVTFVNSDDDEGTLTCPPSLNNQQVVINGHAAMSNDDGEVKMEHAYGYIDDNWSYVVQKEVLVDGKLKVVEQPSASNVANPSSVSIVGDTTFTAKYKPDSAYLLFSANTTDEVTGSTAPISGLKSGSEVDLPACGFVRPGYTFAGWSTTGREADKIENSQNAGTENSPKPDKFKLVGAQTLYALWTPNTISVIYSPNDRINGSTPDWGTTISDNTMKYDDAVAGTPGVGVLAGMAAPDYERPNSDGDRVPGLARDFVGWNIDPDGRGTTFTGSIPQSLIPTDGEPLKLYAQWEDHVYTVSFSQGAGASLKGAAPQSVKAVYGQQISLPNGADVYARTNYNFAGWQIDNEDGTLVKPHQSSYWTFKGTTDQTNAITGVSDVTMTALWEPNPGVEARINVTLMNMGNIPGTNSSQIAKFEGLSEDIKPLENGQYESLYQLRTLYAADEYFTFKNWYAVSKQASASPSTAFEGKEEALRVRKGADLRDIISTFYTDADPAPLSGHYLDPSTWSSAIPPVYWNTETNLYSDEYKRIINNTNDNVELVLWRWAELSKYKVKFHPNAPWGYSDSDVQAMEDQEIPVPGVTDGHTADEFTLHANTYEFPGYEFIGWQTAANNSTVSPVQESNTPAEGARAVGDGAVLDGNQVAALRTATDTDYEVDLYAVWKPIRHSVEFVLYYPGDGVGNPGTETALGTVKDDYYWGDQGTSGAVERTGTIVYNPSGTAEPTVYAGHDDASFAGWYTKPNDASATTLAGVAVNVATPTEAYSASTGSWATADTIGDVVKRADASDATRIQADNGAYHLKLYAKWAIDGARVKYVAGDGATGELPGDQVQTWDENAAGDNGAQIEVQPNKLTKIGYLPDGWKVGDTVYADGVSRGNTADKVSFAKTLPADQRTVTLTANFKDKDFTAVYNYDAPNSSYKSSVNTEGKGTPGKINNVEQTGVSTGLHWETGSLYSRFDTAPALEGYTFAGFEYRIDGHDPIKIEAGMTVADLAAAIAAKTGAPITDNLGEINLYAVWEEASYTVQYNLNGGSMKDGSDPTTTATWQSPLGANGNNLVLPESLLENDGFYEPTWYVNEACTYPANGLKSDATLADIAEEWHKITANASVPLPSTIMLYAKWKEDTTTVIFTVSDTAKAKITEPTGLTPNTDYVMDDYKTQIVFKVGVRTGRINGDSTKGRPPAIVAAPSAGYKVTSWQNAGTGATVGTGTSYQLSSYNDPSGAEKYVAATYEAQIAGDATVGVTVNYYLQDTNGDKPGTMSTLSLKASDFGKGFGDVISPAELDAMVQSKLGNDAMKGLSFDSSRTAPLEVTSDAASNVATLYYNRAQYKLTFAWAYEDGTPAVPASLPAAQTLYVGQESAAFAAPTAPAGYVWDGWYLDYKNWDDKGTLVGNTTGNSTYTMGDANVAITGAFKKSSYTVKWGTQVLTATETVASGDVGKYDSTLSDVTVESGQTLNSGVTDENKATAGYRIDVADISGSPVVSTKGNADKGAADVKLDVKDGYAVSWKYTMNGKTQYTDDPTSVAITGDVTFTPIVSSGQAVTYQPGEHGTFPTSVYDETTNPDGTRFVDIEVTPATATDPAQGYALASYRFPAALKETASADVNANFGNPQGEPGWVFAGWAYRYVDNNNNIVDSAHDGSAPLSDEALATTAELQNLMHSIELTATWEPATTNLVFNMDDSAAVKPNGDPVAATFKSSTTYSKDATPTLVGSTVQLPSDVDVDRPGFTLTKWEWEVLDDDGNAVPGADNQPIKYSLEPGDTIEMPSRLLQTNTTLKAVWTEDKAVIEYRTADPTTGTVTNTKEEVPVWSGTAAGSTAQPARSEFKLVNWTDADGEAVGTETTYRPSRNGEGMYESATYFANFVGAAYKVTFSVGTKVDDKGKIIDTNGAGAPTVDGVQTVYYGGNASMSDLRVEPENAYEVADGRYWDYAMYSDNGNGGKASEPFEVGTTDNPADPKLTIRGHTDFTVHFKKTDGTFLVNYESRGGTKFESVKRKWNDGNLGANKTPTKLGYTFNGWWTDIPGTTAKSKDASDYDSKPGATLVGTQSYGTLAGNMSTADATDKGITLQAGWVERTGYSVNFDLNYTGAPAATSVSDDISWTGTVAGPAVPTRTGYVFTGWYTARNGGDPVVASEDGTSLGTPYYTLAGTNDSSPSQTVYAHWKEREYYVAFVNEDNSRFTLESYTMNETGLDKIAKPEEDTLERRFAGWYYKNVALNTTLKVAEDTSVAMIANAGNVVLENNSEDNPLIVTAVWKYYNRFDTKILLYRDLDAVDEDEPYGLDKPETVKTDWAETGTRAAVDFGNLPVVPGFEYSEAATKAYLGIEGTDADAAEKWAAATELDSIQADYEYTSGERGGQLFTLVYLAKADYTVSYSMNDDTVHPGGRLAAKTADGEDGYPAKDAVKRTFLDTGNTPDGWVAGEADPVRPGFTFGGWVSPQVADDVVAVDGVNTIVAKDDTPLGDLAYKLVDGVLTWYDPAADGGNGNITLYADWEEMHRIVRYIVAEDMKDRVEIRLNSEDADAFSTDERTEVVGAATGDLFEVADNGALTRRADWKQGAVAQVKRGYSFAGWRVIDRALPSSASYSMPLGAGDPNGTAGVLTVASVGQMAAAALLDAQVESQGSSTAAQAATMPAPSTAVMTAAAAGDDTATSSEGNYYSGDLSITPGTRSDNGLFGGEAYTGETDSSSSLVLYAATATLNANAPIKIDPGEGSYNGSTTLNQPWGTYIGETAPWGDNEGALPASNLVTRPGYTFQGWIIPAGTQYDVIDADGTRHTETFAADTPLKAGDLNSTRIIVPQGGLTLKASWQKTSDGEQVTHTVTIPETTMSDGTVLPGVVLDVPEGSKLSDEQIENVINRGGYTPEKWVVTYYDPTTGAWVVEKTLTTAELRTLLESLAVYGDITIAPDKNSKVTKYVPPEPKSPWTRPAKSKAAKTGENAMIAIGASIALVVAVLAFAVLLFSRRRQSKR